MLGFTLAALLMVLLFAWIAAIMARNVDRPSLRGFDSFIFA